LEDLRDPFSSKPLAESEEERRKKTEGIFLACKYATVFLKKGGKKRKRGRRAVGNNSGHVN